MRKLKPLVLLGPPGSGKGTQCVKLVDLLGYVRVATGDLIRDEVMSESSFGIELRAILNSGELVSDDYVCQLVSQFLSLPHRNPLFLFDGFPRTLVQAEYVFSNVLGTPLEDYVVAHISLPLESVIERINARLVCNHCSYVFSAINHHLQIGFICPKCKLGRLDSRSDDSEPVVRRRYEIFSTENTFLLDFFGPRVRTIDGNQTQEHVFDEIIRLICT